MSDTRNAEAGQVIGLFFLLSVGVGICSDAGAFERSAAEQLERMAHAMRTLSYEGTLVYLYENRLETLRVVHRVESGAAHEQLISLNGPVRMVTRENGQVTCKLADAHPISIQRQQVAGDVLGSKTIDQEALTAHYRVNALGAARVAGRQTSVVDIDPRDDLRYGYRFYLDLESGLPLKSDLMGQAAEPIEQIMFTSLNLLAPGDPPVAAVADEVPSPPAAPGPPDQLASQWQFVQLPSGFGIVMHDRWSDASGQPVEHFVLSDGLASVSVYVEQGTPEGLQGDTRIGAVHAAGQRVSGHQVTVVGEVPSRTAVAVLAGIRHVGEDGP